MLLKTTYLEAFNTQLDEFIKDLKVVLSDYYEVTLACHAITGLKMLSSKMIIKVWHEKITLMYLEQITAKDYNFFLEKDYSKDLEENTYAVQINNGINKIRSHVSSLNDKEKAKVLKYVENLCRLSNLYHSK